MPKFAFRQTFPQFMYSATLTCYENICKVLDVNYGGFEFLLIAFTFLCLKNVSVDSDLP